MIERGDVWWADVEEPVGSHPGGRRPVAVVSADPFNASRIATVTVAMITSNTTLAAAPGNVSLAAGTAGLPKDSVVNVTQLTTLDKRCLTGRSGRLPVEHLEELDAGLRLALGL